MRRGAHIRQWQLSAARRYPAVFEATPFGYYMEQRFDYWLFCTRGGWLRRVLIPQRKKQVSA